MVTIDGSFGEGGGQIVRSSLALALVTGQPLTITNVRSGRKRPGLMQQHLAALRAAAQISDAKVEGAGIGSSCFSFHPRRVRPGRYDFAVGTAGSATLVLQTVLPALLLADGASTLALEGGTHNPWAPPFDFLAGAFLPLVNRMGPRIEAKLEAYGFYPAGGGRFTVQIQPTADLRGFDLPERGKLHTRWVRAIVANLPTHIVKRECETIARKTGWEKSCFEIEEVTSSRGPGNVVLIGLESSHVTEVFAGFGKPGVKAERVAADVLNEAQAYLKAEVPVGPYLADQLMMPLAIGARLGGGGGTFRTSTLTRHATTHVELLRQFLDVDVQIDHVKSDRCTVRISATR